MPTPRKQPDRMSREEREASLLNAGRDALLEIGHEVLDRGLKVEHVADRAGTTKTNFHKIFPEKENEEKGLPGGKELFLERLMSSLIVDSPRATQQLLVQHINELLLANKGDPRKAIRELCKWDFQQVRDDPATRIRLFMAVFGKTHPRALAAVRKEYDQITEYGKRAYEETLRTWSATLRKPFSTTNIAVLFTAIVEGLTLRWLLDPESVPDELFGDAIVAFVSAVVDVEERHQHIDDVITPLATEAMREYKLSQQARLPDDPEQAIVNAASIEFAQRGYYSTALTAIATRAGVDLPTTKRLFSTKADILIEGLKPALDEVRKRVSIDIRLNLPPEEVVRHYLDRLAAQATENRALFDALMMVIAHDTTQEPEAAVHVKDALNFPELIRPVVEAGQKSGAFSRAIAADEMAAMLTNALLLQAFTRRDQPAKEIANTVATLMLNGIFITT